jgi:hypothetical protein
MSLSFFSSLALVVGTFASFPLHFFLDTGGSHASEIRVDHSRLRIHRRNDHLPQQRGNVHPFTCDPNRPELCQPANPADGSGSNGRPLDEHTNGESKTELGNLCEQHPGPKQVVRPNSTVGAATLPSVEHSENPSGFRSCGRRTHYFRSWFFHSRYFFCWHDRCCISHFRQHRRLGQ